MKNYRGFCETCALFTVGQSSVSDSLTVVCEFNKTGSLKCSCGRWIKQPEKPEDE